ncbi:XRE family transcriptional regulator [Heyndrickxia oleronia]|uniref:XRE family transcriptional regulator n=1 Tax=Heyndrickxia oleronia TaxID=38875 RepID=A0AAW6SSR9_9BACI|nr:XRE family transcriptional regulator [Heyndrickxia oleronia]MDH5160380.1 XRE family transcriptional regulator [Heyndrickxia oleronia]
MIKDSAYAGGAIQTLLQEEEIEGVQLALDLNVSPQLVSHMKNDRRKMQKDIAQQSLQVYDNPIYAIEIIHEFSGGYTSPVLNGKAIDDHRLAVEQFAFMEVEEAVETLKRINFIKPPDETTKDEQERIAKAIDEIIDAEAGLSYLKAILAKEYNISLKDRMKKRHPVWKARGWIQ